MEKTREKYMEEPAFRLSIYIAVENIIMCIQSLIITVVTDSGLCLIVVVNGQEFA